MAKIFNVKSKTAGLGSREQTVKSFRALVGAHGDGYQYGHGQYLLDSNDTSKFYAFFAIMTGMSREAEEFVFRFITEKVEPYVDTYKRGDLTKPGIFLKDLVNDLLRELRAEKYVEIESGDYSFAVTLVKNGIMYVGRVNSFPMYFLKDRRFKHVFRDPGVKGPASVQVAGAPVGDGDMLLLGSPNVFKHITELELRSVLLAEGDLSLVCSRINIQANKYEETADPRLMAVRFVQNKEDNSKLFNKRNLAIFGFLASLILVAFLWNEIAGYLRSGPMSMILNKNKSITRRLIEKVSMPRAVSYTIETLYDGLTVPYDLAIAEDGIIYVVDDKQEGIVRFNPATKKADTIGDDKAKLQFPTSIDILDDRLYVADFSRRVNRVFIFNREGKFIGRVPDDESQVVSLRNPKALDAVESGKLLYVCDRGNDRILKFDFDGSYLSTINIPEKFKEPNGLAVTDNGVMYVTFKMSGLAAKISGKNSISEFSIYEGDVGKGSRVSLAKPSGIAVDAKGNVYIADTGNQRVVVADQMGKLIAVIDREKIPEFESYYPMSVKIDPRGEYLYIVAGNRYSYDETCKDQCNGKIWRMKI